MADNKEEKEHKYVYAFTNVKGLGSKEACDRAFKAQVEGFKNTMGAFLKTAYFCDKDGNKIQMKGGKEFKTKIWFVPKASLEIADPAIKSAILFEDYKQILKPHNEIKPISQEMAYKIGTAYSPELGIAARAAFEENIKKFKDKKQEQHPEVKQAQEKIQAETLSNLNSLAYGGYTYSM